MASFVEVLNIAARLTPVILVSGGLLAFFFREKIKQVLSKSLLFDVEQKKADLQRELEAYKVSLIGEVERVKAAQEVKKALALRIGEKKFLAIASMLDAHLGLATDIGGFLTVPHLGNQAAQNYLYARRNYLFERISRFSAAYDAAGIFLDREIRTAILAFQGAARATLDLRPPGDDLEALPRDHAAVADMLRKSVEVERMLGAVLSDMEQLGG